MQDSNRRGFWATLCALFGVAAAPVIIAAEEMPPKEESETALFDRIHVRLESQISRAVIRDDRASAQQPHGQNVYQHTVPIDKGFSSVGKETVLSGAADTIAHLINSRNDNVSFSEEIPGWIGFSGREYKTIRGATGWGTKVHLRIAVLQNPDMESVELYHLSVRMGRA